MKNFLWLDLEMTGLDEKTHHILELGAVITDVEFKPLSQFHKIVYQPAEVLGLMDDWCVKTHGGSGLTEAVKTGTPLPQVEKELCDFLKPYFKSDQRIILCGNSISNDRRFIDFYMHDFSKKLHYRMIDVSSFKEVFRERYGVKVEKKNPHRAIDDILESIRELCVYLSYVKIT
ncbi:MAG: oligoribonuclease [Xanthomonadaceae bacterium]|nr:oligoribonuclease [Xanthomonadaceae bacterium]